MRYTAAILLAGALLAGQVWAQDTQASKPKWTGSVTASGTQQTGNTQRTGTSLAAEVVRKTEAWVATGKFLNNYAEERKIVTARNTYTMGKYDYTLSKQLYATASLELYNDQFKNLQLRTTLSAGVGYHIWDDAVKTLSAELGAANINDNLRKNSTLNKDQSFTTARVGANASYKIDKIVLLTDSLLYYPSFDKKMGSRYRNEVSATSELGVGWAIKLTNILERNNLVQKGLKKLDSTTILGLQYTF